MAVTSGDETCTLRYNAGLSKMRKLAPFPLHQKPAWIAVANHPSNVIHFADAGGSKVV